MQNNKNGIEIMHHELSLGKRKFNSILLASVIEMIVGVLMSLVDTAVTGHIIGTIGLSAMNLVGPVTGFTLFTEGLFSIGTSMVYASHLGAYRKEEADRTFGMGLLCAAAIGLATSLVLLIIVPPYLRYMGVSSRIRKLVMDFFFFLYPQLALAPVYELVCHMVITDGGEVTGTAASVAETLLNLVLSIILGRKMGILGIGLGTLISTVIALGIASLHFFSKRSSLRPRFAFDRKDLKKMLFFGANDSALFFLMPILSLVLTKFVILHFGEFYLPILTIINSIFEIAVIFEATGEAMRPIMPIYMGDHNNTAMKDLLRYSFGINLLVSVAFALILLFAGPYIPAAFDIRDPVLLRECTYALRIYSLACPALSVVANLNSFYLNTGRQYLAGLEILLNGLICIIALAIPFGLVWGIRGMMLGFALAPYLTGAVLFVYVFLRYGPGRFPYLLEPSSDKLLTRTILVSDQEIMNYIYDVDDFLKEVGADRSCMNHSELTLEEVLFLILEKNQGSDDKKASDKIYAECCVRANDEGVDLSIWDNGIIFDITNEESEVMNFRSYFVSRMMSEQHVKKHLVATSFNKNFFHFDPEP